MKRRRTFSSLFVVAVALLSIVGTPRTAHAYLSSTFGPPPGALERFVHSVVAGTLTLGAASFVAADIHQAARRRPLHLGYSIAHVSLGLPAAVLTLEIARSEYADPGIVALMVTNSALLITIPIAEWALRGPDPSAVSLRLTPGGASLAGAF